MTTTTINAVASTVEKQAVEIAGVQVLIPVEIGPEPTKAAQAIFCAMCDPTNWKLPLRAHATTDKAEADAVAYAIDWYCGGHEMACVDCIGGQVLWIVGSKGYYHYSGA